MSSEQKNLNLQDIERPDQNSWKWPLANTVMQCWSMEEQKGFEKKMLSQQKHLVWATWIMAVFAILSAAAAWVAVYRPVGDTQRMITNIEVKKNPPSPAELDAMIDKYLATPRKEPKKQP